MFQDVTGSRLTVHMRDCVAVMAFSVAYDIELTTLLIEVGLFAKITLATAVFKEWATRPGREVSETVCAQVAAGALCIPTCHLRTSAPKRNDVTGLHALILLAPPARPLSSVTPPFIARCDSQLKALFAENSLVGVQRLRDVLLKDAPMAPMPAQTFPIAGRGKDGPPSGDGDERSGKQGRKNKRKQQLMQQITSITDDRIWRQGKRARSRTIVPAEHVLITDAQEFLRTSPKVPRAEIVSRLRVLADKLEALAS